MWKATPLAFLSIVLAAPADNTNNLNHAPVNEFALKLLDNVYSFQENFGSHNFAISPLSVWSIFSLLAEGSTDETFQELMKQLNLPRDQKATQSLHFAVKSILKKNTPGVTLKGQTAMFADCSLEIHPEFCKAALVYNTEIFSVDPSNVTRLANDINYYVCVATEGRIRNAVKPDLLADLRMILVDALYFKANWTYPFHPEETEEEEFYDSQKKTLGKVNMMHHKAPHKFAYSNEIEAQILEMNYGKKEEFSMLILLPADGVTVKRVLNNLAGQNLNWMTDFYGEEDLSDFEVYVPRFKISSQLDLIPPLQYSGIHSIFDSVKAQLPGVSNSPLFVSKTIQNVNVDVNEEGTEAAAVTIVGLQDRILEPSFKANKPFVFLIIERTSNVILFGGVYSEPSLV